MAESDGRIEALEHGLMRAWAGGDRKLLRQGLSRRFRLVVAAAPPVLLDRKSMLDAAGDRWLLADYRFSAVYTRETDGLGIFAAELEMEGAIYGRPISGRWWMTDLWCKSTLGRRWRLVDRQLARLDTDRTLSDAVRALQLWR